MPSRSRNPKSVPPAPASADKAPASLGDLMGNQAIVDMMGTGGPAKGAKKAAAAGASTSTGVPSLGGTRASSGPDELAFPSKAPSPRVTPLSPMAMGAPLMGTNESTQVAAESVANSIFEDVPKLIK